MCRLGVDRAALFSNDEGLASALERASSDVEELVWRLPLHSSYAKGLKSTVADIANLSSASGAGSIVAAEFLHAFIEKGQKWAHLDIAGVAFRASESPLYEPKHATGYGVALLSSLVLEKEF